MTGIHFVQAFALFSFLIKNPDFKLSRTSRMLAHTDCPSPNIMRTFKHLLEANIFRIPGRNSSDIVLGFAFLLELTHPLNELIMSAYVDLEQSTEGLGISNDVRERHVLVRIFSS